MSPYAIMPYHALPFTGCLSLPSSSSLQRDRVGAMWNLSYITLPYEFLGSALIRCRLSTASSSWSSWRISATEALHLDSSLSQFRRPSRRERYPNRAVAGVKVRLWEGGMVAGLGCPNFRSII
jgi:hypothetical protein